MIHPYFRMVLRRFLPGLALSTLFLSMLASVPAAFAQSETGLRLDARVGFDGYCKRLHWLPLHIDVENTGVDLSAIVQVSYKKGANGNSTNSLDVQLPANSRKAFTIYLHPQNVVRTLQISLVSEGDVLQRMNVPVNCIPSDNKIFGVIADQPSVYDILNEVQPLTGSVRVAHLGIADLPEHALAWWALDALIISGSDTGDLTPQQKQALKSWIAAGGTLLVVGGPDWQRTAAGLSDILPVKIERTVRVYGLAALRAYIKDSPLRDTDVVLATGEVQDGATVLLEHETEQVPLLVQRQIGMGNVYFFAADPALQPLRPWEGMTAFYTHLLAFKVPPPAWGKAFTWNRRQSIGFDSVDRALAAIPQLWLPALSYICGLLGLYVLLIGPVQYFVLRRMKRPEWAWFTIPGLVILFTGVAYGSGWLTRGTTPILNRLAVIQSWEGVEQARVQALVGVYSPGRARYDLAARDNFVFAPLDDVDDLQAGGNWSALMQSSAMVMPDVLVETGGVKSVSVEGSLPAPSLQHDLVIEAATARPMLSGTITNDGPYTIKGAFLVTPGAWERVGDLPPGSTRDVKVSLTPGAGGPEFYSLTSMEVLLDINIFESETDPKLARQVELLESVIDPRYDANIGNWGIYLMGWIEDELLPVGLQDQKFKTIDTTLFIGMLSPTLAGEDGGLRIPASLFRWEGTPDRASPYRIVTIPEEGYTLHFRPAFPIPSGQVKSLELVLQSNASPNELIASLWSYEEQRWARVNLTGSRITLPAPERFIGPDHEIRIKVLSNRSDWTEITASNVTLVIEP